ncbi:MAG: hypothetical protein ILP19_04495 [Oscillospiraceae bacterium]|nr:hypothetical protein [Oscillospiraceae bacterium]
MKKITDIIGIVFRTIANAVKFIFREGTEFSDPFMKTIAPYSRQSFSENVRNSRD